LTIFKPYRRLIGLILLGVYAFLITPVQFWHHHANAGAGHLASVTAAKQPLLEKAPDISNHNTCLVCSHKYAVFYDNALFPPSIAGVQYAVGYTGYQLPCLSAVAIQRPNKGPPSVI
jgi:hypothetical protein